MKKIHNTYYVPPLLRLSEVLSEVLSQMLSEMLIPTSPERSYKEHQVTGIRWMMSRETLPSKGGLLCDDMGLGKTEQILGLIANTDLVHTLLLCPKSLIGQWIREGIRCMYKVFVIQKAAWKCISASSASSSSVKKVKYIYITNYDSLISKPQLFKQQFDRLCLDEAHQYLCNKSGKMYQQVSVIKRRTTWPITATPVVNSTKDTKNLLSLIGYDSRTLEELPLELLVSEAVLHRSMDELRAVLPNLPSAAIHTTLSLDFASEDESDFYQGVQGKLVKRWKSLEKDRTPMLFQLLMKLRQLSIHPQVYIGARKREPFGYSRDSWNAPSAKFLAVHDLLNKQKEPTKWIIFCQFRDEMDLLENELMETADVYQYHGGLSDEQKERVLRDTEAPLNGKHMVLLLNIKSGGVGLNLQHFTHIIFMSPWWTSALMRQSVGRAVRIGQLEQVKVYHLVLKEEETLNIDAMMRDKMELKEQLLVDLLKSASRGHLKPRKSLSNDIEENVRD